MKKVIFAAIALAAFSLTSCQENDVKDSIEGKYCTVAFNLSSFNETNIGASSNPFKVETNQEHDDLYDNNGAPAGIESIKIVNEFSSEKINHIFNFASSDEDAMPISLQAMYGLNKFTASAIQNLPMVCIDVLETAKFENSALVKDDCYRLYAGLLVEAASTDAVTGDVTITNGDTKTYFNYTENSSVFLNAAEQSLHLHMKAENNIIMYKALDSHPYLNMSIYISVADADGVLIKEYRFGQTGSDNVIGNETAYWLNSADLIKGNKFKLFAKITDTQNKLVNTITIADFTEMNIDQCHKLKNTISLDQDHFDVNGNIIITWDTEFDVVEINNDGVDIDWL